MSQKNRHSTYGELIFVGVIGLVFALQFVLAMSYPADPRLFPVIIAVIGIVLAFATQVGMRGRKSSKTPEPIAATKLALVLVVPPLYGIVLWAFGFWIATILTIPALSVLLGYRRYFLILLVTVGMALAVGLLFPVVNIAVPKSALFGRYLSL
jgi:Tripartite tricarboxylate transporter TctB family